MRDAQPYVLSQEFNYALDVVEKEGRHLFLTGRAGTGKSTWLRLFRQTTRKKVVVLAPTGVAALNVGGQTIHSFFGFPPRPMNARDIRKRRFRKLYERMEVLVIDEVSMVRADLMDHMDRFLRLNRGNDEPFGGVQLVLVGDLFQLPPVVASEAEQYLFSEYYASPWFFDAHVMQELLPAFEMVELRRVFRQDSRYFLRLLDAIRMGMVDHEDLEDLNERYQPHFGDEPGYITLSPYNRLVDRINLRHLRNLDTPARTYRATISGTFDPRLYPTEAELQLKVGAQVMFVVNDQAGRAYVNGTIGQVVALQPERVIVEVTESDESRTIEVEPHEWEIVRYKASDDKPGEIETEVVGTFRQLPLRLAWAVTIHKSQGKTFERVIIDMGRGAFETGQTYVALSRCRTLEGIVLKQPIRLQDIRTDERVVEFWRRYLM